MGSNWLEAGECGWRLNDVGAKAGTGQHGVGGQLPEGCAVSGWVGGGTGKHQGAVGQAGGGSAFGDEYAAKAGGGG